MSTEELEIENYESKASINKLADDYYAYHNLIMKQLYDLQIAVNKELGLEHPITKEVNSTIESSIQWFTNKMNI